MFGGWGAEFAQGQWSQPTVFSPALEFELPGPLRPSPISQVATDLLIGKDRVGIRQRVSAIDPGLEPHRRSPLAPPTPNFGAQ